ncbi:hypothetical protein BC628DRAFT_1383861 [Trametes gibbosa]|nr:hypothetical protein BC628DRAFT_1383861 [Trametes gibbosa]
MAVDYTHPSPSFLHPNDVPLSLESSGESHHVPKSRQFTSKHGSKFHAYDPAQAPWPLSYDDSSIQLEMMDTSVVSGYKGVVSLVDHKGKEPARCLDIGTGLGLWVVQAVKYWRKSTFVGLDLVDVQIPLSVLDPDDAARVEWVYGNILTDPLPFNDDEFDHVRFTQVALGIPENKWIAVFEEIRRVMKPGASVEVVEEDAIFPVLPRWFTEPLHARTPWPSISMQDGSKVFSNPPGAPENDIAHEYELLEILFHKVFDSRFINTKPSSILPAYFTALFGQVMSPPVLTIPMPPLPPVQPRQHTRSSQSSTSSQSVLFGDAAYMLPYGNGDEELSLAALHQAPSASAISSAYSTAPGLSGNTVVPITAAAHSALNRQHSYDSRSTGSGSGSSGMNAPALLPKGDLPNRLGSMKSGSGKGSGNSATSTRARSASDASQTSMASKRAAALSDLAAVSTTIGERGQIELFPIDALLIFDVHSLCLHLRRALAVVVALREAMWDELQAAWEAPPDMRDVDLEKYGLSYGGDTLEGVRAKYLAQLDQYKSDMHVRMSIWHSLVHFGWEYPPRDPISKAEEREQARLREDIQVARRMAGFENTREPPCRAIRVLVGAKV